MRYRKLSDSGDFIFGNSQLDFYRDVPDAPAQAVKTRLELLLGEWYLNILSGTPYIESVLGKKTKAQADATILARARTTQGVTGITGYESTLNADTRALDVAFTVRTIYGPTELEILNYGNF